jgi:hypothetical protein
MVGSVIQMWTMLMATLEKVSTLQWIRERLPCGPPRVRRAVLSLPHMKLMMWGVHALVPVRRRGLSLIRMHATLVRLPGNKTGTLLHI